MRCKFKSKYYPEKRCEEEALSGSNYCILHSEFPKDSKKLETIISEKLSKNDYNFEGSNLYSIDFSDKKISGFLNFRDVNIDGNFILKKSSKTSKIAGLYFWGAKINGNVKVRGLEIDGDVNFGNDVVVTGDLKFNGTLIRGNCEFSFIDVSGDIDFAMNDIGGSVNFLQGKCQKMFSFQNSKIHGEADFRHLEIGENAFFNSWGKNRFEVKKKAKFNNLKVNMDALFNGSFFKESLNLSFAIFKGNLNFKNVNIDQDLIFKSVKIEGKANFSKSILNKKGNFSGLKVRKTLKFINTNIKGPALFYGCEINEKADFTLSTFNRGVNFNDGVIKGASKFNEVKFLKKVDFTKMVFGGMTEFEDTVFNEKIIFNDSSFQFRGIFSRLNNFTAYFENTMLKNVAFKDCNLEKIRFKEVIFENCELSSSKLPDKIIEDVEYNIKKKEKFKELKISNNSILFLFLELFKLPLFPEIVEDTKIVADTYRRIRQSLQEQGEYDRSGKFYYKEMNIKREVYAYTNKTLWIFYNFLWIFSGYGERINILGGWLLTVIFIMIFLRGTEYVMILETAVIPFFLALFVYAFARKMTR